MKITRTEAEEFLYKEARLIDDGRLEEWLKLFTADGKYWIPIDEASDPNREPSILYDDSSQRGKRVFQILHQAHYAQRPRSRTVHLISNVELNVVEGNDTAVRCNLVVFELRPGGHEQYGLGTHRYLTGVCEYRLRYEEDWKIALKKVLLIDRDSFIQNLTFIL